MKFWVGEKDLPVIGTIRVGHVKNQLGLEGDMTSSSRCMTFMERSSYSEAIEQNQNFVTGLFFANNYFDQRVTWEGNVAYADQGASSGAYFGTDQTAVQGRITALPIYKDEGRELLHFGLSLGWRNGQSNNSNAAYTGDVVELRARNELRDDVPGGGSGLTGSVPNADNNRMVDTGVLASDQQVIMGLESLYIRGPFSFQAEYGWMWVDNVKGVEPTATTFQAFGAAQNYVFSGGYVQLAYTLTGENRAYDKRLGTLAREYYGHAGPYEKAFLVRDENGRLCWGLGAWELAARYSFLDLNDGTGQYRIAGGDMQGLTVGLNWYVNNNLNVMFDYVHDFRYDMNVGGLNTGGTSATAIAGPSDGFGTRVQFQF